MLYKEIQRLIEVDSKGIWLVYKAGDFENRVMPQPGCNLADLIGPVDKAACYAYERFLFNDRGSHSEFSKFRKNLQKQLKEV